MAPGIPFPDGPDPLHALRRVAGFPTIMLLHGCGMGWSYLSWGRHLEPIQPPSGEIREWFGLLSRGETATGEKARGWCGFRGGTFLQLDYEVPLVPPTAYTVRSWVAWDPTGAMTVHGDVNAVYADLARSEVSFDPPRLRSRLQAAWTADEHGRRVERIRSYIGAGDVYQVNLTMPLTGELTESSDRDISVFTTLVTCSPAPFSAFLRLPSGTSILSHSPERFLRIDGRMMSSQPIKGTCARRPGDDERTRQRLLASQKDRAELAMIVDLVRNDLGRIAVPGSVKVTNPAQVIDVSYAHHLEATVNAQLRPECSYGDAVMAAYPAGSITGAPKLRAMDIIRELESFPRGPYCGAIGWIGDGGCDLSVAIRTFVMHDQAIRIHAGGGIVSDSQSSGEWQELHTKVSGIVAALGDPW